MEIRLKKSRESDYQTVLVDEGVTLESVYKQYMDEIPYTVLAAKVDNELRDLVTAIRKPCTIEFLDMRNQGANLIYQHSLSFIFLKAIEDVIGRTETEIQNSLNKGLYTEVKKKTPITEEEVRAIENRMKEIVDANMTLEKSVAKREDALKLLGNIGLIEKKRLLESAGAVKKIRYYSLDGFMNFFYGYMVPSTGYIKYFQLRKYRRGVLLRFPHTSNPNVIPEYVDEKKLYSAFGEANRWQKILDISYVTDLNEKIHSGEIKEIIQLSEALHDKKIVEIAKNITENKKRIVLIAGPSSSGKTTFARRLCIQLKVNGYKPLYMGTDDYFLDRNETPLDENGEKDFENLSALDMDLFNEQMNNLLFGKEVDLPKFDFLTGHKIFGKRKTSIGQGQPIVIEGIHALNEKLTFNISKEQKYKIYISPLTQLGIDDHNRIPTTDVRMLRRIVRDYKHRGHNAQSTIASWPKVRAGEDKNIFPYNSEADAFFNSSHIYELSILKKYVKPLLKHIEKEETEYAEANRMLRFLDFFESFEDDSIIVNNSILREFIGGSVFTQ